MPKHPPTTPTVQVWSPAGFDGLELERLDHVPSFAQRVYHTDYEINVLLRGESRVRYRRDHWAGKVSGSEPLVFVQSVDEVSQMDVTVPTLVTMRNLRLSPDLVHTLLPHPAHPGKALAFPHLLSDNPAINRHLARLAFRLFLQFETAAGGLAQGSALLDLVTEAARHLGAGPPEVPARRREHRAVALVKAFMRDRPEAEVSLRDLAALTGLSAHHVLTVFRREVGVSPHVFQRHVRVQAAKRLLAQGVSIAEVAAQTGFSDQSHLNRVFKRVVMGVTPGRYRRESDIGTPTSSKTAVKRGA